MAKVLLKLNSLNMEEDVEELKKLEKETLKSYPTISHTISQTEILLTILKDGDIIMCRFTFMV